jgi:hypothetical protein
VSKPDPTIKEGSLSVLGGFSHWDLPKPRDCEKGCVVMFKLAMQELLSISMIKESTKIKIWKFRRIRGVLLILLESPWWIWEPPSDSLHEYGCTRRFHKFQTHGVRVVIFLLVIFCQILTWKIWFPPMQRIFLAKMKQI